jgi:hypothetical protein
MDEKGWQRKARREIGGKDTAITACVSSLFIRSGGASQPSSVSSGTGASIVSLSSSQYMCRAFCIIIVNLIHFRRLLENGFGSLDHLGHRDWQRNLSHRRHLLLGHFPSPQLLLDLSSLCRVGKGAARCTLEPVLLAPKMAPVARSIFGVCTRSGPIHDRGERASTSRSRLRDG